jgi:hypothetical protein
MRSQLRARAYLAKLPPAIAGRGGHTSRNRVYAALGDVIGTRELCAWQIAPGVIWIQTRSPEFARKLSRRSDARLVAKGVAGGFLRTFVLPRQLSFARKLIARYTAREMVTNDLKTAPASPTTGDWAEERPT